MRAILADDHPVVLLGLRAVLQKDGRATVVGEATSADELWDLLAGTPCDLLITDYSMPAGKRGSGLALIEQLRRTYPELPIIIVTMISNAALLKAMLDAGANGVLEKSFSAEELPEAVLAIMRGRSYLGQSVLAALDAHKAKASESHFNWAKLSPREAEVVRLYISGLSVTDIAERLSRSVKTVSTQRLNAMRKLGISSDADLYAYSKDSGMLS
ncbi:DNA-binding response regulator [Dyella tabacisoli]|uniref:DNA-binding response regulator n=1 Tax=Dyella tabacisoli TaxID=2282381 RepID=A0A369UN42_9GAMM|nr:DNA-binding response regulator [Dyella tabacisoli]